MFETMYGVEYPDLYLVRELHVILPVLLGKEVENPRGGGGALGYLGGAYARYQNLKIPHKH